MIRGTTPTITLELSDGNQLIDLSGYDIVIISIKDADGQIIDLVKSRLTFTDDTKIEATLTQEETLALKAGRLQVQIRARLNDMSIASEVVRCGLEDIIKPGVI